MQLLAKLAGLFRLKTMWA